MNHICSEIKCPFFTSETDKSLSCEGSEINVVNTMRFPNCVEKLKYIEKHCVHYPNECHISKAAEKKYY